MAARRRDAAKGPMIDGLTPKKEETPTGLPVVELFTDGSCRGNPGPGGWAFILKHPASGKTKEGSGGEPETTNNRMELTALIKGLEALKTTSVVHLWSDSKYVLDGFGEWMHKWHRMGWKRSPNSVNHVKNDDLWRKLYELSQKHHVKTNWVRGHQGHVENERCDELATSAADAMR